MSQRYDVYHNGKHIAVIHAEDAGQAISLACRKTDHHDPAACTACSIPTQSKAYRPRPKRQL